MAAPTFPSYFAVFHTEQRRYAVIFGALIREGAPIKMIVPALTFAEREGGCECNIVVDPQLPRGPQGYCRLSNMSRSEFTQAWAYTQEKLYHESTSEWVPVVCFYPGFPDGMTVWYGTPLIFPFKKRGETTADSHRRVKEYLEMKRMLADSPVVAPAPPVPPVPPVPPFVGEALLYTAEQKGDCCPISMTPYADISVVSITPCYHLFEHESLSTWLQKNASCPTCKAPLHFESLLSLEA